MVTLNEVDPRMIANNLAPFCPTHPGSVLKKEIEYRKLRQVEIAKKLGLNYTVLNDVLNERRTVTAEYALIMEAAFGIPAYILVGLQSNYTLQKAKANEKFSKRLDEIRKIAATL